MIPVVFHFLFVATHGSSTFDACISESSYRGKNKETEERGAGFGASFEEASQTSRRHSLRREPSDLSSFLHI